MLIFCCRQSQTVADSMAVGYIITSLSCDTNFDKAWTSRLVSLGSVLLVTCFYCYGYDHREGEYQ